MQNNITVRCASESDAIYIAQAVAMAIGDERTLQNYCGDDYISVLTLIASGENTQYSWRNSLIASVGNCVAGVIVGYDGALLGELRDGTFKIIGNTTGNIPSISDETAPGEYYLDSIAVFPEFRGMGVADALLDTFCTNAFSTGFERVGLIVDCENLKAEYIYSKIGFQMVGYKDFFGHKMKHLQKIKPVKSVDVVAAIIINNGKLFATQRGYGDWRGWWEFPGGKIEPQETPQMALKREIKEELDANIEVGDHFCRVEWDYPKFHLNMDCYLCSFIHGSFSLKEHKEARWLSKDELYSVKWLPADMDIIEKLSGYLK